MMGVRVSMIPSPFSSVLWISRCYAAFRMDRHFDGHRMSTGRRTDLAQGEESEVGGEVLAPVGTASPTPHLGVACCGAMEFRTLLRTLKKIGSEVKDRSHSMAFICFHYLYFGSSVHRRFGGLGAGRVHQCLGFLRRRSD